MSSAPVGDRAPLDLRLAPMALATWGVTALAVGWPTWRAVLAAASLFVAGLVLLRRRTSAVRAWPAVVATLVVAGAAFAITALRVEAVQAGPLAGLAAEGASARVTGTVTSDPVRKEGQFAPYVLVSLVVDRVTARGQSTLVRSPVLVIGEPGWLDVAYGERVEAFG